MVIMFHLIPLRLRRNDLRLRKMTVLFQLGVRSRVHIIHIGVAIISKMAPYTDLIT